MEIIKLNAVEDMGIRESINHKGKEYRRLQCISEDNKLYRFNTSVNINKKLLESLEKFELPYFKLEQGKSVGKNKVEYYEVILPEEFRDNIFKTTLFKK